MLRHIRSRQSSADRHASTGRSKILRSDVGSLIDFRYELVSDACPVSETAMVRYAAALLVGLPLMGCMYDEVRQLQESEQRQRDTLIMLVKTGQMSPQEAAEIAADDAEFHARQAAERAAETQSSFDPAPTWQPTYQAPAHLDLPTPAAVQVPTTPIPYAPAPTLPPAQWVPYQVVAPLMPGIGPDGTAR
jgi:hypothetical protein